MEPADYQAWLDLRAEGSMALEGRKVFLKYRCISCHSADENARAPVLEELYGRRVHLRDGRTVVADEDYIRESIFDPGAKIVAGYENIMPTFKGQVSEEEVYQLIAFIKSLKRGQTPPRVEEFPPPVTTPPINEPKKEK
jgi:cytochrome c oxidase subunit 2